MKSLFFKKTTCKNLPKILPGLSIFIILLFIFGCKTPIHKSSAKKLTTLIVSYNKVDYSPDTLSQNMTLNLVVNTSISTTAVIKATVSSKAKCTISNKNIDFNNLSPITIEVTAEDGSKKNYTLTINSIDIPNNDILSFIFKVDDNKMFDTDIKAKINHKTKTITATVPYNTNRAVLKPIITHSGKSIHPTSNTVQNFTKSTTNPITYTVTATNDDIKIYTVIISRTPPNTKTNITNFVASFSGNPVTSTINKTIITLNNILLFGTNINSAIITTLDLSRGATTNILIDGILNFQNNKTSIIVTAENGKKITYTIKLTPTINKPTVTTYTGTTVLGQAIHDDVLNDDNTIISVDNLANIKFDWIFGNNSGEKQAVNNVLTLTKTELTNLENLTNNDSTMFNLHIDDTIHSNTVTIVYKQLEISTWQDLQAMRKDLTANYILTKNIIFPDEDNDGKGDYNFFSIKGKHNPYVNVTDRFRGSFDGQNHTITHLCIKRDNENYVGLFGYTDIDRKIINVGLIDNFVSGKNYVGGLVGQNFHSIVSGYTTGNVLGDSFVGGLVGYNFGTTSGYTTGRVSGTEIHAGGLVGYNLGLVIGYTSGHITGNSTVGGLVGHNLNQTIGYAIGHIKGNINTGGLVGTIGITFLGFPKNTVRIAYGYWDNSSTSQQTSAGGGVKISNILNVTYNATIYTDTKKNIQVFNNTQFTKYFDLPNESMKWPKLKSNLAVYIKDNEDTIIEFNFKQPNLP